SVDKYEIDSTYWIQYSDGSHLRAVDTFFIRELQTAVAKGDKKSVAGMISYPFERSYPLKPIANESEFIANYNSLLPAHIRERIIQSALTDWTTVGWRGTMLDNGLLWFTDFDKGTKISRINYDDKQQQQILIDQERKWIGFNQNESPSFCFLAHDSSLVAYVTYDHDGFGYRVRLYHRGDSFKHPYINTICKQGDGGTARNIYLSALVDSLWIEVWYCFDSDLVGINYGCSFAVVDKNLPQEELDYYPADSVVEMTPVYLRDIVRWW
ncbi:MAG: hypothetical protein MJZ92_06060, partial [Paludibacteraceae bacterium]|nr:hypothetical protein [Paludibacteraceae bacterium]